MKCVWELTDIADYMGHYVKPKNGQYKDDYAKLTHILKIGCDKQPLLICMTDGYTIHFYDEQCLIDFLNTSRYVLVKRKDLIKLIYKTWKLDEE